MERINAFFLEKHEGPYEKWPRRTGLFFDGKFTGTKIPGFIVEAQYRESIRELRERIQAVRTRSPKDEYRRIRSET